MFPPSDGQYLYPTRIPYEESSVFSSVNFQNPDYEKHPLFRQTTPHMIELSAGDILFVPHLWWHFVRVIEEDFHKSCISINNWVFNECYKSSLNESIVRFLTTALFNTYCPTEPSKWLNTDSELFTPEEAVKLTALMLRQFKTMNQSIDTNVNQKQILPQNYHFIESSTFDEMKDLLFEKTFKKLKCDQKIDKNRKELEISPEMIVNCILDPEVIQLIATKLQNIK